MREIKYRVWDLENKEFYSNELLRSSAGGIVKSMKEHYKDDEGFEAIQDMKGGLFLHLEDKNFVYMQYTGMKDAKNQDIYEGDLVSFVNEDERMLVGLVKFERGCFYIHATDDKEKKWSDWDNYKNIMIWGNMYEYSLSIFKIDDMGVK